MNDTSLEMAQSIVLMGEYKSPNHSSSKVGPTKGTRVCGSDCNCNASPSRCRGAKRIRCCAFASQCGNRSKLSTSPKGTDNVCHCFGHGCPTSHVHESWKIMRRSLQQKEVSHVKTCQVAPEFSSSPAIDQSDIVCKVHLYSFESVPCTSRLPPSSAMSSPLLWKVRFAMCAGFVVDLHITPCWRRQVDHRSCNVFRKTKAASRIRSI